MMRKFLLPKSHARFRKARGQNCRIVAAFVSMMDSINSFPAESKTAAEIVAWCTSSPIYLTSFNIRALLSVGVDANDLNLLQRGALL